MEKTTSLLKRNSTSRSRSKSSDNILLDSRISSLTFNHSLNTINKYKAESRLQERDRILDSLDFNHPRNFKNFNHVKNLSVLSGKLRKSFENLFDSSFTTLTNESFRASDLTASTRGKVVRNKSQSMHTNFDDRRLNTHVEHQQQQEQIKQMSYIRQSKETSSKSSLKNGDQQ